MVDGRNRKGGGGGGGGRGEVELREDCWNLFDQEWKEGNEQEYMATDNAHRAHSKKKEKNTGSGKTKKQC